MPKRYCILLSLASILFTHISALSSANGKDATFFQSSTEYIRDQLGTTCIRVFDLEENALKTYILDTTIHRFRFSDKEGVLYGLSLEEELPIVKYRLD